MAQIDSPAAGQPDQAEERGLDPHALWNIEQGPTRPESRVQRREEVIGGRHRLGEQVTLEDLGTFLDSPVQVDQNRTA